MNDEEYMALSRWIAAIVKATGGQILIPYNALEEIGEGYSLHYEQIQEGILLSLKQNWVLDVSGYTNNVTSYNPTA